MNNQTINLNKSHFISDVNSILVGTQIELTFNDEVFSLKNKSPFFELANVTPSKVLIGKIKELFSIWFNGFIPKFNNSNSCFWPEVGYRFAVCIYDIERQVHRYKVISSDNDSSPSLNIIMPAFGYFNSSRFKVIRFVKVTSNKMPELCFDDMGTELWSAILNNSDKFTVEFDSNHEATKFTLVDDALRFSNVNRTTGDLKLIADIIHTEVQAFKDKNIVDWEIREPLLAELRIKIRRKIKSQVKTTLEPNFAVLLDKLLQTGLEA